MESVKVLWLSRHEMTAEQSADLEAQIARSRRAVEIKVIHMNTTFPANGDEAAMMVKTLAHEVSHVAGVFPAHVAVSLAHLGLDPNGGHNPVIGSLWLPVSVPAPAKDGEVRGGGFAHSHWERFDL